MQRASVSCQGSQLPCSCLHVLWALWWVLQARGGGVAPRRAKTLGWWQSATCGSALHGLPWVQLVTVTAPEPCLPSLPCCILSPNSFYGFRFSHLLVCRSPFPLQSKRELLEGRDSCLTHLWPLGSRPEQPRDFVRHCLPAQILAAPHLARFPSGSSPTGSSGFKGSTLPSCGPPSSWNAAPTIHSPHY